MGRVHHISSGQRLKTVDKQKSDGRALKVRSQGLELSSVSPHQKFTHYQVEKLLKRKKYATIKLPTSSGMRFEIGKQSDPKRYAVRIDPEEAKVTFTKYSDSGKTSAEFRIKLDNQYDQPIVEDSIAGQIHALLSSQVEEAPNESIIRFPGVDRQEQRQFHLPDERAA